MFQGPTQPPRRLSRPALFLSVQPAWCRGFRRHQGAKTRADAPAAMPPNAPQTRRRARYRYTKSAAGHSAPAARLSAGSRPTATTGIRHCAPRCRRERCCGSRPAPSADTEWDRPLSEKKALVDRMPQPSAPTAATPRPTGPSQPVRPTQGLATARIAAGHRSGPRSLGLGPDRQNPIALGDQGL